MCASCRCVNSASLVIRETGKNKGTEFLTLRSTRNETFGGAQCQGEVWKKELAYRVDGDLNRYNLLGGKVVILSSVTSSGTVCTGVLAVGSDLRASLQLCELLSTVVVQEPETSQVSRTADVPAAVQLPPCAHASRPSRSRPRASRPHTQGLKRLASPLPSCYPPKVAGSPALGPPLPRLAL